VHYKNGREAKNGDKVLLIQRYTVGGKEVGAPVVGILYDAQPGNDFCNGKIAPISPTDPMPSLADCLHLDDVLAAVDESPKTRKPVGSGG
jgi:hypothetical protein